MIDKLIREYIIARMNDEEEALEEFVRIGAKEAAAFQRSLLGNNAAIISFIDSLQEEPVSEDLEEAARRECKGLTDPQEIIDCYCQFIRGANWQKQQMMKSAKLDGWIARDEDDRLHLFEVEPRRLEKEHRWWDRDYHRTGLDESDFPDLKWEDEPIHVKLIIIKED